MDRGVFFHTLYVKITNSQHHKKRVLIVIHFNPSRLFFYSRGSQPGVHVPVGVHLPISKGIFDAQQQQINFETEKWNLPL